MIFRTPLLGLISQRLLSTWAHFICSRPSTPLFSRGSADASLTSTASGSSRKTSTTRWTGSTNASQGSSSTPGSSSAQGSTDLSRLAKSVRVAAASESTARRPSSPSPEPGSSRSSRSTRKVVDLPRKNEEVQTQQIAFLKPNFFFCRLIFGNNLSRCGNRKKCVAITIT